VRRSADWGAAAVGSERQESPAQERNTASIRPSRRTLRTLLPCRRSRARVPSSAR